MAAVKKILMVDDDPDLREALADQLVQTEEFDVFEASDGAEGLARAKEQTYDLVILDVGLPDMDGTQVFALLTQRHPDLPIVFSTGHADRAKLDAYLERPHVSCLLKPYESSSLLTAIRDVMA